MAGARSERKSSDEQSRFLEDIQTEFIEKITTQKKLIEGQLQKLMPGTDEYTNKSEKLKVLNNVLQTLTIENPEVVYTSIQKDFEKSKTIKPLSETSLAHKAVKCIKKATRQETGSDTTILLGKLLKELLKIKEIGKKYSQTAKSASNEEIHRPGKGGAG